MIVTITLRKINRLLFNPLSTRRAMTCVVGMSSRFVNACLCYGIGFDSAINWRYQTRPPLLYRYTAIALRVAR